MFQVCEPAHPVSSWFLLLPGWLSKYLSNVSFLAWLLPTDHLLRFVDPSVFFNLWPQTAEAQMAEQVVFLIAGFSQLQNAEKCPWINKKQTKKKKRQTQSCSQSHSLQQLGEVSYYCISQTGPFMQTEYLLGCNERRSGGDEERRCFFIFCMKDQRGRKSLQTSTAAEIERQPFGSFTALLLLQLLRRCQLRNDCPPIACVSSLKMALVPHPTYWTPANEKYIGRLLLHSHNSQNAGVVALAAALVGGVKTKLLGENGRRCRVQDVCAAAEAKH